MFTKDCWKPFKFSGYQPKEGQDWFKRQKLPLYIPVDAQVVIVGPFIFVDRAFLPGIETNWGYKLGRLKMVKAYPKLGRFLRTLDDTIYLEKGGESARTIPFAWFIRTRPPQSMRGRLITLDEYIELRDREAQQ